MSSHVPSGLYRLDVVKTNNITLMVEIMHSVVKRESGSFVSSRTQN